MAPGKLAGNGLRAVVFDWDGTLVDSAESTYRCYSEMFRRLGVAFDRDAFARSYSPAWQRTYEALGLPRSEWARADAMFVEIYAQQDSVLLPGARDLLQALERKGLKLALVTSGSRQRVPAEAALHGLDGLFGAIVCGEDVKQKKPHPEALLAALDRIGVDPSQAVYVGDSPEDIGMAKAAGSRSIGLLGAFPNREALRASSPDLLVAHLDAARAALLSER